MNDVNNYEYAAAVEENGTLTVYDESRGPDPSNAIRFIDERSNGAVVVSRTRADEEWKPRILNEELRYFRTPAVSGLASKLNRIGRTFN